jgi:Ca2+/Na+ antiporter
MALTIVVILGGILFLLLIPMALICLIFVIKFNSYLYKNYPGVGRTNAWKVNHLAMNDPTLSKMAKRVRISLYAMLAMFIIFMLCGAAVAVVGTAVWN